MAILQPHLRHESNLQVHRFPLSKSIDFVRFLPSLSPFNTHLALSLFDPSTSVSTIEIHSLTTTAAAGADVSLSPLSSFPLPARPTSLKISPTHIAVATDLGSLHFLSPDVSGDVGDTEEVSISDGSFHIGSIECVDVIGSECVSVGEDGRVNLVSVGGSGGLSYRRIYDSNGLVSYTAAKWASPVEFATGGLGFSLQWWDQRRKPGEPVVQFKANWAQKGMSGIVHCIDIHPSRKHTCLAGGSLGTLFTWDLRWPQQPVVLSGSGTTHSASESDVWEVQFDCHSEVSNISSLSSSSSKMLPAMICSEDGILAVVEPGAEPVELLAEPCAINSFDVNKQNYSNIVCGLEWESVAVIKRS